MHRIDRPALPQSNLCFVRHVDFRNVSWLTTDTSERCPRSQDDGMVARCSVITPAEALDPEFIRPRDPDQDRDAHVDDELLSDGEWGSAPQKVTRMRRMGRRARAVFEGLEDGQLRSFRCRSFRICPPLLAQPDI